MKKVMYLSMLSVLFLFSCSSEELQILDSSNAGLDPVFSKGISNAPEQSGAYVFRFEGRIGVYLIDFERGISATFGLDNIAFCNNDPDFLDVAMNQIVDIPSSETRAILLQQGEIYTEVFDGIFIGEGDLCDFLLNSPKLGQGMTKFVATDNDPFVSAGNNTNSWGARGHGQLINEDNEIKKLSANTQFVWDKEDRYKERISLRVKN